ncbi:hypothetical protein A6A19_04230 [Actinobacillus delphinicola]|uniref:peptidylprolyl isomerase n=1 Tax=Actinobacillus delphinicola TaxID=51161 RepID=UPI002441B6D9|nr:peptidylprolyl isomerase [Actinobacillus delphinicola]MDG6897221.1 hypothetical protein [Actinobacillus delphinicola]
MRKKTLQTLLVSCIGFSAFYAQAQSLGDRVVASVNGAPILQSQVNQLLQHHKATPAARKEALNELINQALLATTLQQAKITVPQQQFQQILKQEVDRQMQLIAQQNGMSYGQFLLALTQQGVNLEQYRSQLAAQIAPALQQQVRLATLRDQVIGQEVNTLRQSINRNEIQTLAKKLEAEAKTAGKHAPITAKQYDVRHILLTINPLMTDSEAKAKLAKIRNDILTKKISFGKAALEYSKDYLSGANGGDLGYQFPDMYAPAFAKTILSTPQGKISQPFKSTFGWHILEVTGSRQQNVTNEVYMQKAYEMLMRKKLGNLEKNWIDLLRKNANIQIDAN